MGWLITLGILTLLAVLPLGVSIRYNDSGPLVRVVIGPVKLTVFPMPKKEKKKKQKKEPEAAEEKPQEPTKTEKPLPQPPQPPEKAKEDEAEKGGSLLDFLPLVKVAVNFLGDFRRKLRINELYVKLIMAGGDPCDLAVNYGRAWAGLGNLMPRLDSWFTIKKRDVEVECDFTASQTLIIAHLELTITLGRIVALLVVYGIRALKEFLTIKKKRKGGAVT